MRWGLVLSVGMVLAAESNAVADRLTDAPAVAPVATLTERVKTNVTLLADEIGHHLSAVSLDTFNLRFDAHKNVADVGVDLGSDDNVRLKLDSNVVFRGGVARVRAKLDLGIAGRRLEFELPEFDMVPRSFEGKSYVELRLPLIERDF